MRRGPCIGLLCVSGCLGDVEIPPEPPVIQPVTSPTQVGEVQLVGTKPKGTGVVVGEQLLVEAGPAEAFETQVRLAPGENVFELATQRPSGLRSRRTTSIRVVYEPLCPTPPTLDPLPQATRAATVELQGTKPSGTAIYLGDNLIVPLDDATRFSYSLALGPVDGRFDFVLTARDARGQASEPLRFRIAKDSTPPSIVAHSPTVGELGVPRNSQIWINFAEPLVFDNGTPPPGTVTLVGPAGPLSGLASYHLEAHALVFTAQTMPSNSLITVQVDPSLLIDEAGNRADPSGPFSWSFTTGPGLETGAPPAPTWSPPPAQVNGSSVLLSGTKAADTGIRVNGELTVGLGPSTAWSYELALPVGTSSIGVEAIGRSGLSTALPGQSIERLEVRPAPPQIPSAPSAVAQAALTLSGTKPAGTGVLLGDQLVVCRGPETTFSVNLTLTPGTNELRFRTQDEAGAQSDPVLLLINYERQFSGTVPEGYTLKVSLGLRDLASAPGIRNEFETGPNNYGLDVWVEGPVDPQSTCTFSGQARSNINYVATLEHYLGKKTGHTIPFADVDYRGADYLAALISAGVFSFRGLSADSPRRDANGREVENLLAGLTEDDIHTRFDCEGQVGVDTCTQATTNAGRKTIRPWVPRRRGGSGLLEQGEYLLFIQINLDRLGSWLIANDQETCWDDEAHRSRGMHRIVARVPLGAEPFTLRVPQTEERSGPDREGSNRLYFIESDGVTISWGP